MAWLWLVIAILLMLAELFMGTYYFLALAISAFLTAIAAWLWTDSIWFQALIMAVCSVASMYLVPVLFRRANQKSEGFSNDSVQIVGMRATVIRDITPTQAGVIKLATGAKWTAKADKNLTAGDSVRITEVSGTIAIVDEWQSNTDSDEGGL